MHSMLVVYEFPEQPQIQYQRAALLPYAVLTVPS